MSRTKYDVVVFGATGFTGRLVTRYLAAHPQFTQGLFSFAIAARSQSKLHNLVQELSLPPTITTLQLDVTDYQSVQAAVKSARVVINTVGPYWSWGTPVVKACAVNGVHYVDITGEDVWVRNTIRQFDYLATKTGAIIVHSCGYDSIPSDLTAFVSNKTLKAHGTPFPRVVDGLSNKNSTGPYEIESSVTAQKAWGGASGGTLATVMNALEVVPREELRATIDYSLSPVKGRALPVFQFLYNQSIPGEPTVHGGFFFMQPTNRKVVQRTFGLLEMQARYAESSGANAKLLEAAQHERYGPSFAYDEFLVMPSRLSSVLVSTSFAVLFGLLALVAPFRWIVKKFIPQPGEGPSEEYYLFTTMKNGYFVSTNHTVSTSTPPVHVKTVFRGDRDPGYGATSIMLAESALCLVLPPMSSNALHRPSDALPRGLPALAVKGGVLTPMTAFGSVLVTRLLDTGRFSLESSVVGEGANGETRKNV
ncbi:hypothetical protein H0H81_010471 [Sphagnurus paluster]|uniref:Saccharopine dehydrogenase NADP binding domain-containing protein n=1 Tax=Sphagnurus paluster TaxID=117069 RepID=A0A9P7KIG1_9AGAR|nr:hypothetical protein H0H81_010471 [Sphagnurus paluster]